MKNTLRNAKKLTLVLCTFISTQLKRQLAAELKLYYDLFVG